jgi:SWIM zinc finger
MSTHRHAPTICSRRGAATLSAAGAVGYDLASGEYYGRELPFSADALEAMHPRLRAARQLVARRAVTVDGTTARVQSGDAVYTLERETRGWRCSCLWFARHGFDRGICKHALAVGIESRTEDRS